MRKFLLILFSAIFLYGQNYKRVVSLGPYITENLHLLGIDKEIIGVTIHEREERKKGKEIIGTLLQPNTEKILSLKPDLVIASKEGNTRQSVEKLKSVGLKVVVTGEIFNFNGICDNFLYLARIFNKEKTGKEIVKREKERLERLKKFFSKYRTKKVFFCLGIKPLFTAGGKSYIDEMIRFAGGKNIFGDIKRKYIPVSFEEVIKRDPDVIIQVKMGSDFLWNKFENLKAVKNNRVFKVEPTLFCSPTPKSFVDAVEKIGRLIHGEKIKDEKISYFNFTGDFKYNCRYLFRL